MRAILLPQGLTEDILARFVVPNQCRQEGIQHGRLHPDAVNFSPMRKGQQRRKDRQEYDGTHGDRPSFHAISADILN